VHLDRPPAVGAAAPARGEERDDLVRSGRVTDDAMEALQRAPWPGNIRELRNVVERAVVLWRAGPIDRSHFKLKGQAGKCYRAYAESDARIKGLNLVVKDSAGDVGAEDSTDDTNPVLVEDGAFCFKHADEATLVISVGDGNGAYAFVIYSD
jgi:DNA-binding NtrC family response regulator